MHPTKQTASAAFAAFVTFFTIGGVLFDQIPEARAGEAQHAQLASERAVSSTERRLRGLEFKTDYYKKRHRALNQSYTKNSSSRASCPPGIRHFSLTFNLAPVDIYGTAYAWITTTVRYKSQGSGGDLKEVEAFFHSGSGGCSLYSVQVTASGGSFTQKRFCSLDISKGDRFVLSIQTNGGPQFDPVDACEYILAAEVEVKTTEIEIVEPE
jgi:hypothetical protein